MKNASLQKKRFGKGMKRIAASLMIKSGIKQGIHYTVIRAMHGSFKSLTHSLERLFIFKVRLT
jgi:hypothetical protein